MKASIYHDAINGKLVEKIIEQQSPIEEHQKWEASEISEKILEELETKRNHMLQYAMKGSDSVSEAELRGVLREALSITKTINLMRTGKYE